MIDLINHFSNAAVFMLCSWNAGFNHFFNPEWLTDYLDALHVSKASK